MDACFDIGQDKSKSNIPYARHYKPRLVYFLPHFQRPFLCFKEVFSENSIIMYGLYSRAAYDGARTVV